MTIELKTGKSREYRREDYITKVTGTPRGDMPTPIWNKFLDDVTNKDKQLQLYLQRMAGYCCAGVVTEHVFFFLYGTGANGKGVFLNTLKGVWGDYAVTASMDTFLETRDTRHPTELAFLHGARLVIAQETERGRRWAQAKLQALTGGDEITARFMRQDFFTFKPKFKLVIAGNHKPSLSSVDEAIKRRFHLVPFNATIPKDKRDPDLADKLKAEWPGILEWAIQGCLEWQRIGLAPPPAVTKASKDYFDEEDTLTQWIEERCALGKIYKDLRLNDLFDSWKRWAEPRNERVGTIKAFSQNLEKTGLTRRRNSQGQAVFDGIALRDRDAPL
jgi:putative DNA primase/helicase